MENTRIFDTQTAECLQKLSDQSHYTIRIWNAHTCQLERVIGLFPNGEYGVVNGSMTPIEKAKMPALTLPNDITSRMKTKCSRQWRTYRQAAGDRSLQSGRFASSSSNFSSPV